MSVYVEMIIPHDFHDLDDKDKALAEIHALKTRLENYFHITKGITAEIDDSECFDCRYSLHLNVCDIDIELGNGFLYINGGWNYSQYFMMQNNVSWLRDRHYDMACALGKSEAYITNEYHGSNNVYADGKEIGMHDMTFALWQKEYPNPPILTQSVINEYYSDQWSETEGVYLDTFEECRLRKQHLQDRLPDVTVLTSGTIVGDFLLALKDGNLIFVNETSGKILRTGKIDGFYANYNQNGFVIYKGNRAAFFCTDGKRVTPYRATDYSIKYDNSNYPEPATIHILDKASGKIVYTTTKPQR